MGYRRACRIVWDKWLKIGARCGLLGLKLQQFVPSFDIGTGSLLKWGHGQLSGWGLTMRGMGDKLHTCAVA